MANHVSGYIVLENVSEAGQKVWNEFVIDTVAKHMENYETHLGHFLFEEKEGEFVDWDFNKMCDEIGAKWAYATDYDEGGLAFYSAWSPVEGFCELIASKIGEVCKDFRLVMTYEDEMPNFVGVSIFDHTGLDEDFMLEHEELLQMLLAEDSELNEMYDHDECEWKEGMEDEAWEILSEIQHDFVNDWQSKVAYGN
jgi:hypothetical protein